MTQHLFDYLTNRNLIALANDAAGIDKLLSNGPFDESGKRYAIYCGFDPTASSLTIGHLTVLLLLRRAQDFGLQPIILLGGATGLVGDPTGKSDMRPMNTAETIAQYCENFAKLMHRYFRFDVENKPIFVNNLDWIGPLKWLEFNRDIAVHFNVARMIAADANRSRLEHGGLTMMEMSYQLMQAYDWLHLYKNYNCVFQVGGNDQWSNILAGAELIRKVLRKDAFCFTQHIIADKHGKKIGKTAGNAVWIDGSLTSPYDLFQFVRNLPDETLDLFYRCYTTIEAPIFTEQISKNVNTAKEQLAIEVTKLVHGEEEASKALIAAKALFSGQGQLDGAPTFHLSKAQMDAQIDMVSLLVEAKICASKGEARRLIQGNGLHVNDEKIDNAALIVQHSHFIDAQGGMLIKKGKKDYFLIKLDI